jgi:hypothetical protein
MSQFITDLLLPSLFGKRRRSEKGRKENLSKQGKVIKRT